MILATNDVNLRNVMSVVCAFWLNMSKIMNKKERQGIPVYIVIKASLL